ncbi:hypothetical protein N499_0772B, partial [Wolbachia pipientis wVitA]
RT